MSNNSSNGTQLYYKPIPVETSAGIYWKADGTIGDNTSETDTYIKKVSATNTDQYIAVAEGEVYRITMGSLASLSPSFNATQCVFLNDNDEFVANAFDTSLMVAKTNELLTVPEGATKMHFTAWSHTTFKIEKQTTEPYGVVNEFELLNYLEKVQQESQTFNRKTFAPFDKAYITFVVDDCRGVLSEIVDVFVNKSIPLCSATIAGTMTNLCSTGTVLDALRKLVENGGEILSHGATQITEDTIEDFDTLYDQFAKSKELLELYGFDVNGVILAGGTGQVVGDQRTDKWARAYYQYSDLYGNSEYGYPYHHYRTALSNYTLETAKAKVDEAIENKEWIIFYLHEWAEFSQSDMEVLLDYINEKTEKELGTATYKQMYDNFCIKHPKQLVSIIANKGTAVYEAGSTINTNDVSVTAYYNDGSTEEITSGITVDLGNINTSNVGDYYASITWSGKTVYIPISIYSTDDKVVLYSGKDGNYITWELYNDGTMELTNTASWKCVIPNYADGEQPWYDYMNMIKFILQSRSFYADLYYGTSSFEFKDSALENAIYTLKDNIVKIYGTANNSFLDSFSAQNFSMNYNLYLFALNNTGTVEYGENDKSEMQIRYCKIWDGDTLVRDFVPAIDNGTVCMYDNITKAYFYPIGDELSLNYE